MQTLILNEENEMALKKYFDISTRTIPGFIEMLSQFSRECSLCPMMLISFRLLDKRRKRWRSEDDEESAFAASLFPVASTCILLLLLASSANLGLSRTTDLLLPVLQFLDLLPSRLLLVDDSVPGQSVFGFVLLRAIHVVVDEGESDGLIATEESVEPEGEDDVGRRLVHFGELVADFGLWHSRTTRMQHIHNHLFSVEKTVGHKLPGPDGDRLFFCHFIPGKLSFLTKIYKTLKYFKQLKLLNYKLPPC